MRQRDDVRGAEQVAGEAVVDPAALQDDRGLEGVDGRRDRVGEHGLRVLVHRATSLGSLDSVGAARGRGTAGSLPGTVVRRPRQGERLFGGAKSV